MLSIRNLSHTYPNGVRAIANVNLDIPKGMFGLLGPNGAGKSSLMRTLATLQQPSSGEIQFDGTDVLRDPALTRRKLGYLPQDFGVYPRGSAFELLDHIAVLKGLTSRAERKREVNDLLALTNLYDVRKKRVSTFSGGMRQRFGIAQALLGGPRLIIVDEPTAGLDPQERNRFHNLLSEIGEDIVVILSTHIVDDVADLCPRMAVMAEGRIVAQGTPSTLIDELTGRVWTRRIDKVELSACKQAYRVISSHLSAGRMLIRVENDSCPGEDFVSAPATLEDVYFVAINPSLRVASAAIERAGSGTEISGTPS